VAEAKGWPLSSSVMAGFAIENFLERFVMRANDKIAPGDFLGGEIEPGTFHHWCGPTSSDPKPGSSVPSNEPAPVDSNIADAATAVKAPATARPGAGKEITDNQS
jgi:hypothetical protein